GMMAAPIITKLKRGIRIVLPFSEPTNPNIEVLWSFDHMNYRKKALQKDGDVFLIFPGGTGTDDEWLEVLLMERKVIFIGKDFWLPKLLQLPLEQMPLVTDSVDEVVEFVMNKD